MTPVLRSTRSSLEAHESREIAGANAATGNNESVALNLTGEAARVSAIDKWTFLGQGAYAHSDGETQTERFALGTQYTRDLTPVWFDYEGNTVLLNLAAHRKKVDWLRKDPEATFLLMNPQNAYHWLSIKATVTRASQIWREIWKFPRRARCASFAPWSWKVLSVAIRTPSSSAPL